ncbi:MAG: GTP pyrophosphokinase family protein [Eubacteriales bacterium]|nr:GTP pyrophosphokinase family protein [Lachnospiraceae bacterium]MDO5127942.1 GTP pyrophosphokinase family protein [Eubacteriales bacterium]
MSIKNKIKTKVIDNIHPPVGLLGREDFLDMIDKNTKPYRQLMSFYRCAVMEIETKFRVLDEELSLESEHNPIEGIKSRIKSIDSLVRKMNKKGIPLDITSIEQNIFDIAGVRVICSFPEDIYFLEECLLKQDDIRLIERKDYIKNPKPGGYRSLHLIVEVPIFLQEEKRPMKVEVQLRTIAMDFWASLEHKLRYKKDLDPVLLEELKNELLDCANQSAALDLRMENVRKKIEKEVLK